MGKTTVAVAAAYDPQIIARFGQRRVFVNLEQRTDPLDLLILLAGELGLTPEPTHNSILEAIRYACGLAPAVAILDNADGLIESNGPESKRVLGFLRDTPGLSFVVTSRQSLQGLQGWQNPNALPPLTPDESSSLFCDIANSVTPDDPDLEPLLTALDGHALSISILASRVDGDLRLKPMLERWRNEKTDLLILTPGAPEDRRTSVRASLRLSLTSRHMTAMAKRLLAVLGFLPDGLPEGGLKAFLGAEDRQITAQKSDAATDVLRRLRLITPRANGSLKLLNPLREGVLIERPLKNPDLERVLNAGLKLLEKGKYMGTDQWRAVNAELLPHIRNFAPILIAAGRSQPIAKVLQVIEPARELAISESRFEQTAFLDLASVLHRRSTDNSKKAEAAALNAAGDLALRRDDLDGAKTQQEAARDISVRIGWSPGEAHALRSLGDLARRLDDLDGAKTHLETARAIFVRIGARFGDANALRSLGDLALRRDDLDGAKTHLERARDICVWTGYILGEANALRSLGALALRRDDLDGAKKQLQAARDISARIGSGFGEANTAFTEALASTGEDMIRAEAMYGNALKKYQALGDVGA